MFIFQTGYGCAINNTTDTISRIKDWSGNDRDRFESVEDCRDIDNDSNETNLTEFINNSDLDSAIMEVNSMNVNDKVSVTSAILGSWHTTPRQNSTHHPIEDAGLYAGHFYYG